jgi:hypothetical protein
MPGSCAPPTIILPASAAAARALLLLFPHECFVFVARPHRRAETFDLAATRTRSARATATTSSHAPRRADAAAAIRSSCRSKRSVAMWRTSSPRAAAGARGAAGDERAARVRAASGESTIAWTGGAGLRWWCCGRLRRERLRVVEMCEDLHIGMLRACEDLHIGMHVQFLPSISETSQKVSEMLGRK